ncbi:MAG: hypothetical protein ABIF10_07035 [Candidatus Woesearchaeota archaeon]
MENCLNTRMVEQNEHLLLGKVFTELQLGVLKKRLHGQSLNSNERTYYYKFIKPRIKAMMALFGIDEINVKGKELMVDSRLDEAVGVLRKLELKHKNKRMMLSGSFLFLHKYNDIDVFIFSKYDKADYKTSKVHVNFLPESTIDSLFFASLCQISVANFSYKTKQKYDIKLSDVMQTYELLVNALLEKQNMTKILRDFILQTEYVSKAVVLNPKQLHNINRRLEHKKVDLLSDTFINALSLGYDAHDLSGRLRERIEDYTKLRTEYKTAKNLPIYIDTYSKVLELAT